MCARLDQVCMGGCLYKPEDVCGILKRQGACLVVRAAGHADRLGLLAESEDMHPDVFLYL